MNTLKDLLDKLYEESETRNKENMAVSDYESTSYEVGVQSTIKEVREWLKENTFSWEVSDNIHINLVRAE